MRHTDRLFVAPCPVLTIRASKKTQPALTGIRSILVPVDFSKHAREALRYAKVLAEFFDARLDLLHVIEDTLHPAFYGLTVHSVYDVVPDLEEKAEEKLRTFYWETKGWPVSEVCFKALAGKAARVIAKYAEQEGTDLIVIATHGLTGLEHYFMGSVAERVVRRAPCPVFTVKSFGKSLIMACQFFKGFLCLLLRHSPRYRIVPGPCPHSSSTIPLTSLTASASPALASGHRARPTSRNPKPGTASAS